MSYSKLGRLEPASPPLWDSPPKRSLVRIVPRMQSCSRNGISLATQCNRVRGVTDTFPHSVPNPSSIQLCGKLRCHLIPPATGSTSRSLPMHAELSILLNCGDFLQWYSGEQPCLSCGRLEFSSLVGKQKALVQSGKCMLSSKRT